MADRPAAGKPWRKRIRAGKKKTTFRPSVRQQLSHEITPRRHREIDNATVAAKRKQKNESAVSDSSNGGPAKFTVVRNCGVYLNYFSSYRGDYVLD